MNTRALRVAALAAASAALLLASACTASREAARSMTCEDYLAAAEEHMAAGKFLDAKNDLEEASNKYRSADVDARMLSMTGEVHYQLKEYEAAIETYTEFLNLHPRNPEASRVQYQVGMCYFKMMKPRDRNQKPAELAREVFSRVTERYPRSPEAREAALRLKAVERALAEAELFVGKFYLKKKNYRGAVSRFEKILRDYPETGLEEEALYCLGEAHRRMEEPDKAQTYFELLLERYPSGSFAEDARDFLEERRG